MRSVLMLALAALARSALAQDASQASAAAAATEAPCSPLELVIARGTAEPGTYGVIVGDPLLNATQNILSGTTGYALPYPANFDFGPSVANGTQLVIDHLTNQPKKCPDQKFAMVGYSQGAEVMHLALSSPNFPQGSFDKIVAVVMYGDPSNKQGDPLASLPSQVRNKLRENCACGDSVCSNGTSFAVHIQSYLDQAEGYTPDSAAYIKKQYQTDGQAGNNIYTSCVNGTLQYCTNTTLGGSPNSTTCSDTGSSSSSAASGTSSTTSSGSVGTGAPLPGSNSTGPIGTGTGTASPPAATSITPVASSAAQPAVVMPFRTLLLMLLGLL